jgi:hypothetical protein
MANSSRRSANQIRAILMLVLTLIAPITLTITMPVVPIPTATGDQNTQATEPATLTGRAWSPSIAAVAGTRREAPSHIHPPARKDEHTVSDGPPPRHPQRGLYQDTPNNHKHMPQPSNQGYAHTRLR